MESHRLITLHTLAKELQLPPKWLRDEALAGRIPCLQVGRRLYFNVHSVEAALLERAARQIDVAPSVRNPENPER